MRRSYVGAWLAAGMVATLSGCAHAPPSASAAATPAAPPAAAPAGPAANKLRMEGAVVRTQVDPLTGLETYDPETLFHLAAEAARRDDNARAIALYERLLAEFAESRFRPAAAFNLGRLLEDERRFGEAADAYRSVSNAEPPAREEERRVWLDCHYRLSVCLGELGEWWDAVAIFDRILALTWIDDFDRLQALVGRGLSLRGAGEPDLADVALSGALRFYEEANARERLDDRGLAAEAAYAMGEIAAARYHAVVLAYPQEVLKQRLEEKCELLLSAQHRFLRAIRFGDAHTVAAAGFQIGSLYESLYDVLINFEVPPDLTPEQVEVYREEVRTRVSVLVKKAIMVYEKTLMVGRAAPSAAPWVARIEQALARLRTLYLAAPPS